MDEPAQRWAGLSSARLRWALDAYQEFVASLHTDIKSRFVQSDASEAYVVVFGRTQVGKTTLLLELMGVRTDALPRVSLVLRGGREAGMSATATAMEYSRSPDHRWRLRTDRETVFETDAQMTAALAEVREEMGRGQLQAVRPLALAIPDDCFAPDNEQVGQERIRILDLPGDNPKDHVERDHVNHMAQTYVPNADLILLVGRADDLSFLNPAALSLHSIRDWRLVPERFRIITTYSFTLASVREKLRHYDGPADSTYFRQSLRQEIATFGLEDVDSLPPQLFFPLEFGQSWQQAAIQGQELVGRIGPVIAELKAALMKDIRASATEYGRLRSATQVNLVAKRVKKERLQRWGKALQAREVDVGVLADQVLRLAAAISRLETLCQERERAMHGVLGLVAPAALEVDRLSDGYCKPDKSRDRFRVEIGKRKEALARFAVDAVSLSEKAMFETGAPLLEEIGVNIEFDAVALRQRITDAFRALLEKLDGYSIDRYHTWTLMSAYDDDVRLLRQSTRQAEAAIVEFVKRYWDETLGGLRKSAVTAHAQADGEYRQRKLMQVSLREKLEESEQSLQADIKSRDAFAQEMDRESEAGDRFAGMLEKHYAHQFMAYRNQLRCASTPTQALLHLLAARQLMDEKHKVMMGDV